MAPSGQIWHMEFERPAVAEIEVFRTLYPQARVWLVGPDGVTLEEFFSRPAVHWFQ